MTKTKNQFPPLVSYKIKSPDNKTIFWPPSKNIAKAILPILPIQQSDKDKKEEGNILQQRGDNGLSLHRKLTLEEVETSALTSRMSGGGRPAAQDQRPAATSGSPGSRHTAACRAENHQSLPPLLAVRTGFGGLRIRRHTPPMTRPQSLAGRQRPGAGCRRQSGHHRRRYRRGC